MNLALIVVGRLKDRYLEEGVNDYFKRLRRYGKCELIRVREEKKPNRRAEATAIEKEAERILQHVKPGDHLIAMTEQGACLDSPAFAAHLDDLASRTPGRLLFVIGSGPGLAPSIKEQAKSQLSLSPLTFPHQVALLLLLEQLYRTQTILRGEPYHR